MNKAVDNDYKIILELSKISHSYGFADTKVDVLKNLDFVLKQGQVCALLGPSGSGKSTILQISGLLDTPSSGEVMINHHKTVGLSDIEKSKLRGQEIGFIYQFHRLLPELTAIENVMMPQLFAQKSKSEAQSRALELLDRMGLSHRGKHLPSELSGGEQQRVAIARALANKPSLILADEPTGNLDPQTSDKVFRELTEFVRQEGASALIATHNMDLSAKADFIFSPFTKK